MLPPTNITLSTYIEDTPSPPNSSPPNDKTLAAKPHKNKRPTQKHGRHTLPLLVQQECAFLEGSITRAENKTSEIAKQDKTNKRRISIDKNHQLPNHQIEWKQMAKNASHQIAGSLYHAFKLAKTSITQAKTVCFAMTRIVRIFQDKEVVTMITYDSGMDGHYLSKCDCNIASLPILR
jgi:hypothetical protein